jgi:hypothetical protein
MPKTTPEQNKAIVLEALRHSLQQARLRGSKTSLVAELHPAQRAHRART